jgi:hypothetical protein
MKAYGGNGGISAPFLTSALDGMWLVSFTPLPLYLQDGGPQSRSAGKWKKSLASCRQSTSL